MKQKRQCRIQSLCYPDSIVCFVVHEIADAANPLSATGAEGKPLKISTDLVAVIGAAPHAFFARNQGQGLGDEWPNDSQPF